jgi:uncharacterized tellurite resistance protein B-like protein
MLQNLREFFDRYLLTELGETSKASDPEHAVRLATAGLMVEVMRADFSAKPMERRSIIELLRHRFGLTDAETHDLVEAAEAEADAAVSLYPTVSLLNETLTPAQKVHVIELLWRVALSDVHIDKYEEGLIRKVADLLFVPHPDFIQAKHRALR